MDSSTRFGLSLSPDEGIIRLGVLATALMFLLVAIARWSLVDVERPWNVANPDQIPTLLALLGQLHARYPLTVAQGDC